jgi:hypothetical protein
VVGNLEVEGVFSMVEEVVDTPIMMVKVEEEAKDVAIMLVLTQGTTMPTNGIT